jgi:hypothetical protein
MTPLAEPSNFPILITNAIAVAVLISIYFFGVWLRTFILPPEKTVPVSRQLVAAIPAGLITMGVYAKSALPPLLASKGDVSADIAITIGYAIILGMMSRETLDKLLTTTKTPDGSTRP